MKYSVAITSVLCIIVLPGCNTIGSVFSNARPDYTALPADAMRQIASEIEAAVQQGEREPVIADREGLVVNSERVRHAIRTRAIRSELLNAFRDSGFAIEQRNGLINIITNKEYGKLGTRRDRDRNALLIMSENNDRWALYEGIIKDSTLSPKALDAIQQIFYEARIEQLNPGQKYESESGEIVQK